MDGYCQSLSLAFEYDGEQHYRLISRYRMTQENLDANIRRDRRKNAKCAEHGVILVRIPAIRLLKDALLLNAVVSAIEATPEAKALCRRLRISLPGDVAPALRAAMHDTGDDGEGQLLIPGVSTPVHLRPSTSPNRRKTSHNKT